MQQDLPHHLFSGKQLIRHNLDCCFAPTAIRPLDTKVCIGPEQSTHADAV
jgi:hypothetical protein